MALRALRFDNSAVTEYAALSTDTKPDVAPDGAMLLELDTGKRFLFDAVAATWREVGSPQVLAGLLGVRMAARAVEWPSEQFEAFSGTSRTADNDIVYQSADVSMYNLTTFQVDGSGTLTVQVKTSPASDWSPDVAFYSLMAAEAGGGYDVVTSASTDGNVFFLPGRFYQIQILCSGTTAVSCWGNHANR